MRAATVALQGLGCVAFLLRACCALTFNTSGANSIKFPDSPADLLFSQITTDLHRFTKTGIHIDMVEQPYCSETEPSKSFADFPLKIQCLWHYIGVPDVLPSSTLCDVPAEGIEHELTTV